MTHHTAPPSDDPVQALLDTLDPAKRADTEALMALMHDITGQPAALWAGNIVGYGQRHYAYASGRKGSTFLVGFAPRKPAFSLYLCDVLTTMQPLLERLGKHTFTKGCLYIRRLADVDADVLREMLALAVQHARTIDVSA